MNVATNIVNTLSRSLSNMFPGYFDGVKHNHYADFGWPTTITFTNLYDCYRRNGVAKAAVNKTVRKVWQTYPYVREREGQHTETTFEKDLRQRLSDLRVWQKMAEAERRYLVGGYSGLILRFADNAQFSEPVGRVPGGLEGLVGVVPAWKSQLTVAEWNDDPNEPEFGEPKMYSFVEAALGGGKSNVGRSFNVHPDRVILWSSDGTIDSESLLESGYNDLMTMEKVSGSGGEGFWKNAKSSPILQVDKDARLSQMATAMGVAEEDLLEAMNEQTEAWQKGFDKLLMLQGMEAKLPTVELPDPENFYGIALQAFAASIEMPVKVLVGMQTGERASTEDAKEWAQTCMGRRSDVTLPNILQFMNRLERFGIVPEHDWWIDWADLTANTVEQMIDRVVKMSSANQQNGQEEPIFTVEEMREMAGMEGPAPEGIDPEDDVDDEPVDEGTSI